MNLSYRSDPHSGTQPLAAAQLTGAAPNLSKMSVLQLLQLCLDSANDELLWTEFTRRSQPLITGAVMKSVRRWTRATHALVDDLVQETYLKLCANDFKALRNFQCEQESAFYSFLKVVACNVVHDHFRNTHSQKRGRGQEEQDLQEAFLPSVPCKASINNADLSILMAKIDGCLADRVADPWYARDYAIFWLYYREGLTAKAISRLPSIGLTVKGVESVLNRLTRFLRVKLNRPAPQSLTANYGISATAQTRSPVLV